MKMKNNTKILLAVLSIIFLTVKAMAQSKPEVYVQFGHHKEITSISFSKDGKYIATGSEDRTIKLWDILTGREIRTILGHSDKINSILFSPDSRYIASASSDNTIKIFEIETGLEYMTLTGHSREVNSISFSPDGRYLASSSSDATIKLWDLNTRKEIKTFPSEFFSFVKFSPDGSCIATKAWVNKIAILEPFTGKKKILQGHDEHITSIDFSSDGKYLVSGGFDKKVKIWEVSTGQLVHSFEENNESIFSVAFSPDNKIVVAGSFNSIKIWDIEKKENILTIQQPYSSIVAFSPDGKYIAATSEANTITLYETVNGKEVKRFKGNFGWVNRVKLSPDNKYAAIGFAYLDNDTDGAKYGISLIEMSTGKEIKKIVGFQNEITAFAFSSDSKLLVTRSPDSVSLLKSDSWIKIWDVATANLLHKYKLNDDWGEFVEFLNDGKYIISHDYSSVILLDVKNGQQIEIIEDSSAVKNLIISQNGKYAAWSSGPPYLKIKIMNLFAQKIITTIKAHKEDIESLSFSTDGKYIVSGSHDKTIKLWETETGNLMWKVEDVDPIKSVAFSSDGKFICYGTKKGSIKLLRIADGNEIINAQATNFPINFLNFSSSGRLIAAEVGNREIIFLNPQNGNTVAKFTYFYNGEWVTITPEGYYDASANGDKYLNVRIGNRVYGIENYRETFFRPDLVKLALSGQALKDFKTLADIKLPPQVEILNAPISSQQEEIDITVKLTDQGGGIGDVRLYLNETAVLVDGARGLKKKSQDKTQTRSYRIKLVNGENVIKAVAFNADNTMQSNAAMHTVAANLGIKKPKMYVLAIGINEFKNPKLELQYAVADAKLFVEVLKESAKELFEKIEVRLLTTKEETTKESIKAALEGMRGISPEDVFVFYVASHGIAEEGEYFLFTSNVGSVSTNRLREDALTQAELKEMIANVSSTKKFIALDACNSGKLGEELQVAMLARTRGMSEETAIKILSRAVGSMIISASTTQQEALEGYEGHGLFTFVLAEGLRGKADKDRDGVIRTVELADYVDLRVPDLAEKVFKRAQYPTATQSGQAFPIGKAK